MCQTENKKIEVKEDLVCYKVERKHSVKDIWITLYRNCHLKRNEIISANGCRNYIELSHITISGGYFHSFANLEDAIYELETWGDTYENMRIVKCFIPKGIETFTGFFKYSSEIKLNTYASRKIFITDEVVYCVKAGKVTNTEE